MSNRIYIKNSILVSSTIKVAEFVVDLCLNISVNSTFDLNIANVMIPTVFNFSMLNLTNMKLAFVSLEWLIFTSKSQDIIRTS